MDARYIGPHEACWRILGFDIHSRDPAVQILTVHAENMQHITIADNPHYKKTTLTEWRNFNATSAIGHHLTYLQFPSEFVWSKKDTAWSPRQNRNKPSIGRFTYVHPNCGDLFYERMLLCHQKGRTSFPHIHTVNEHTYTTYYRGACEAMGLLGDDHEWMTALDEAAVLASASELRSLFVQILIFCDVVSPVTLWESHWEHMAEDIPRILSELLHIPGLHVDKEQLRGGILYELQASLAFYEKSFSDFSLPQPPANFIRILRNRLIMEEMNYNRHLLAEERDRLISQLNEQQRVVFDKVIAAVTTNKQELLFVYGHGGTGKTFLWKTVICSLRSQGKIVLVVASSGIASLLLPSGRTTHSSHPKVPTSLDSIGTEMFAFDVIEEILLRSDAKDLVPWKRVCKSWYSLISSHRFAKAHLKHTCDSSNELGHVRIAMPSYWKIPNERLYEANMWKVVGSYNGLVCIFRYKGDPLIVVNNPCTREFRKLPMAPSVSPKRFSGISLSFAYDSSTDDYKVVMGIEKSSDLALVQVLSLKSNTWKLIGQFNYSFIYDMPGTLFNGKLYWFVFDYQDTRKRQKVILSFDLSREEFQVIPPPNDSKYEWHSHRSFPFLGIVDDQICLFFADKMSDSPLDIWVMRSYNVEHSWELLPKNYELKHEIVHHMKMIEYASPKNKRMTFFCDDNKCLSRASKHIIGYRFVPSLVSPHSGRPSHAENNKTSAKAWSIKAVEGEEGQNSQAMVRRIIIKASEQKTRQIEEVYRRELGETENLYVHEDDSREIEEIRTKLEGVTLCAERGRGREE